MKEKLKVSDYKTKIQILTHTPESWSRKKASKFFDVPEYTIRAARKLKEEELYLYQIQDMAKHSQKKPKHLLLISLKMMNSRG